MKDLSFAALEACQKLSSQATIERLRQTFISNMIGLTGASTGLLLGFDQSGSHVVPLAGNAGLELDPVDTASMEWLDHPLNYLFTAKKCLWEGDALAPLAEARTLLFGVEAFGRVLAVPGRTQPDGYADVVHVMLVPTNVRPTWRTFRILSLFADNGANLLKRRLGSLTDYNRHVATPNGAKRQTRRSQFPYWDALVGESPSIKELRSRIERFAPTNLAVLITGETGTGKEMVARALHEHSKCRNGPFVAVNTTTLPSQLIESEIFGHVKGAFTGANENHVGLISRADGGTLFLDEIGDLPFELQAKLLRVLQERRFRAVGGDTEIHSDFRLILATHRDLETLVEKGTFRQDLYYRINQARVHVPPLRERGQDILLLTEYFLQQYAERTGQVSKILQPEVRRALMDHAFPGNVRELMALIERAAAAAGSRPFIHSDHLLATLTPTEEAAANPPSGVSLAEALTFYERSLIAKTFETNGRSRKATAHQLKVPLRTLAYKLDRYGIE